MALPSPFLPLDEVSESMSWRLRHRERLRSRLVFLSRLQNLFLVGRVEEVFAVPRAQCPLQACCITVVVTEQLLLCHACVRVHYGSVITRYAPLR